MAPRSGLWPDGNEVVLSDICHVARQILPCHGEEVVGLNRAGHPIVGTASQIVGLPLRAVLGFRDLDIVEEVIRLAVPNGSADSGAPINDERSIALGLAHGWMAAASGAAPLS